MSDYHRAELAAYVDLLMIVDDFGGRPALPKDFAEVMALLPAFLERQARIERGRTWKLKVAQQLEQKRLARLEGQNDAT